MMAIEWIKEMVSSGIFRYSRHADQERQNDDFSLLEITQTLLNGRIIEQYPDSGRGEGCLVVGFTDNNVPIHIVCGSMGGILLIITVYIPTPPKFTTPFGRGN
ncbi:MAG: DUF4258 domain-containing protein [Methylovulum sp.]|uniref:DUF4258 domain-containing protein n=1 Tax=Methylovulum sp. TaxID=1916980 RepID=UPI00261A84E0|nr:DUF4258 domain-containing protein [Methylovulum sp.]MDD2723602.1 DUF4258 domain-containing protein [Methylovulum sp.]MDD5125496.1 DUF4258 domain-containing protein [Methylovulum sp.]